MATKLEGSAAEIDLGVPAGLNNSVKGLKGCEAVLLFNGIQLMWKKWIGKIKCVNIFLM